MRPTFMNYLSWEEVADAYGENLVSVITDAIRDLPENQHTTAAMGIRSFLAWHSKEVDAVATSVRSILLGKSQLSENQKVDRLVAGIRRWRNELKKNYKGSTPFHMVQRLRWVLDALNNNDPVRFPVIAPRLLQDAEHPGSRTKSLGEMPWPELDGYVGIARERKALELVKNEALKTFEYYEQILTTGHDIVLGRKGSSEHSEDARREIASYLKLAIDGGEIPKRLGQTMADPAIWREAGFQLSIGKNRLESSDLSALRRDCLAPSPTMNLAHLRCIVGEIGWNKQPSIDIARSPFVLQTEDQCGIITWALLDSWKKRASHYVSAYLENPTTLPKNGEVTVRAELSLLLTEIGDDELYHEEKTGSSALEIIMRYRKLAEESRTILPWLSSPTLLISFNNNPTWERLRDRRSEMRHVGFRSIRRTVLLLKKREIGSVAGLRAAANHADTKTLQPHYLNQDEGTSDYEEKIRFVQNSVQAVLLEGRKDIALAIGMSVENLDWFVRGATISGLRAALVPDESNSSKPLQPKYLGVPSQEYLETIFLIHFSLVCSRFNSASRMRWRVQGRKLLIFVIGVVRSLKAAGLGMAYRAAAKKCVHGLRVGTISLPVLMIG